MPAPDILKLIMSENSPASSTPPKLVWPKYVLAGVVLFFALCVIFMVREVNRLKRAKQEGMEMRGFPGTN